MNYKIAGGLAVPDDAIHHWHGAQKIEVIQHFVRNASSAKDTASQQAKIAEIDALFQRKLMDAYFRPDSGIKLIHPSLPAFFARIRQAGIKVALNTGYPVKIQQALLQNLQLAPMVKSPLSLSLHTNLYLTMGHVYPSITGGRIHICRVSPLWPAIAIHGAQADGANGNHGRASSGQGRRQRQ